MSCGLPQKIGANSGGVQNDMETFANPIPGIQNAKHNGELLYCGHALQKMLERQLRAEQIEQALNSSGLEILENYPQVGRPSAECLILGTDGEGRSLHILVAYPSAEIITAYQPSLPKWLTPRERGNR